MTDGLEPNDRSDRVREEWEIEEMDSGQSGVIDVLILQEVIKCMSFFGRCHNAEVR